MKHLLALTAVFALASGSAFAACGMKDTASGKLTSYNKETKAIVVELEGGKTVSLTLTPASAAKDAAGKAAKVEDLVGKPITVVSEHKKVDSVVEVKKA